MSSEHRSLKVFEAANSLATQFEFFITGMLAALIAYIGQKYEPQPILIFPENLMPLSLILFVVSLVLSLKLMEQGILLARLNAASLDCGEKLGEYVKASSNSGPMFNLHTGGALTPTNLPALIESTRKRQEGVNAQARDLQKSSPKLYRWRNRFLIAGFVVLVAGVLLQPYFPRENQNGHGGKAQTTGANPG